MSSVFNVLNTDTLTEERQKVFDLHEAGWTVRDIAKALDVSTQRIYQQLNKLELVPNDRKANDEKGK